MPTPGVRRDAAVVDAGCDASRAHGAGRDPAVGSDRDRAERAGHDAAHGAGRDPAAGADPPLVDLGAAADFAVLGYAAVTSTGPTSITGHVGTTTAAITGLLPAQVLGPDLRDLAHQRR